MSDIARDSLAATNQSANGSFTSTLTDNPPTSQADISVYFSLLLSILCLYFILILSYLLQRRRIKFVHETVISIILGMIIGAIISSSSINKDVMKLVSFDDNYFFNLLLPPIILNSGFEMNRSSFFRHFGTILIFAFVGTFMSSIIIGTLLFFLSCVGFYGLEISFLNSMIVGSILSSTDPVTVLSLFQQLKVDPKLYTIIFGESLLNDSVAIVLFTTLGSLRNHSVLTLSDFMGAVFSFVAIFSGSLLIGVFSGLSCALLLKATRLDLYPSLETCLVVLQAYMSYLLSNTLEFSGIVSLLFCGICMKHYAFDNLSSSSKHTTKEMFKVLSQMSENFIFIYLGMTLFTKEKLVFLPVLILLTLIFIMAARYCSVFPLASLVNMSHKWRNPAATKDQIPENYKWMLWFSGLRGAIAFALSMKLENHSETYSLRALQTTILVVCVVSVVVLGGLTPLALVKLEIETGDGNHSQDSQGPVDYFQVPGTSAADLTLHSDFAVMDEEEYREKMVNGNGFGSSSSRNHWFLSFDQQYLKPLFQRNSSREATSTWDMGSRGHRESTFTLFPSAATTPDRSFVVAE